jgi:histidinol dehydrogenase
MKILDRAHADYEPTLQRLARRGDDDLDAVTPAVRAILDDVRARGDAALRDLAARFDGGPAARFSFDPDDCARALRALPTPITDALRLAADRIEAFHLRQREGDVSFTDADGVRSGGACARCSGWGSTRRAARRDTRRAC